MRAPFPIAALVTTLALTACAGHSPPPLRATVALEPRSGSNVSGRVELAESKGQLRAHVELTGLEANSEHGFHVHEKGDCSAPDASSAGGHFNPFGTAHGHAGIPPHHAGDLPSLIADSRGRVNADLVLEGLTLGAGTTSIAGRSLVVHRDRDDFTTQPAGNAGPRLACGVLTVH
jgi:Cu-Zn family superoxide dismutase